MTPQPAPDIHSSSEEYARRFAGPLGEWLLAVQRRAFLAMLKPEWRTLLDVGGGHAQITPAAIEQGLAVTVTGSSGECAQRLAPVLGAGRCEFTIAPLTELPFPDQAFDVVACFRQISHLPADWRTLVAELCRVARHAVVIDYPPLRSSNMLSPILFRLKRRIEGNTRPFTVFRDRQLARAFAGSGFRVTRRTPQFFVPMGLHRGLKNPGLSARIEGIARCCGLTAVAGSPVVLLAERNELL